MQEGHGSYARCARRLMPGAGRGHREVDGRRAGDGLARTSVAAGAALGAALFRASLRGPLEHLRMPTPFLGPCYDRTAIESALADFSDRVTLQRFDDFTELTRAAAERIQLGQVIGWYRGRMEFGPRALGNRSILADPGHPEMRQRINAMVKMREAFRPFAPAVTIDNEASADATVIEASGRDRPGLLAALARILKNNRAPVVNDKSGALVEWERPRVVEGAGMHPKPSDRA